MRTLNQLREAAAGSATGAIEVTIDELNAIQNNIKRVGDTRVICPVCSDTFAEAAITHAKEKQHWPCCSGQCKTKYDDWRNS